MAAIYTHISLLEPLSLRFVSRTPEPILAACFLCAAILFRSSDRLKEHILFLRSFHTANFRGLFLSVVICSSEMECEVAHVNTIQSAGLRTRLAQGIRLKKRSDRSEEKAADIIIPFQMVIWMATNGPLSKSHRD